MDDRSNSLVLVCNEPMKGDVETLVNSLDNKTVSTTEVVKLVPLKGIDPALVQQAVNAMQGIAPQQQGGRGGFGGWTGRIRRLRRRRTRWIRRLRRRRQPRRRRIRRIWWRTVSAGVATAEAEEGGIEEAAAADRGGGGGGRGGRQAINLGSGMEGPLNFDYPGMDAPSTLAAGNGKSSNSTIYDPMVDGTDRDTDAPAPSRFSTFTAQIVPRFRTRA